MNAGRIVCVLLAAVCVALGVWASILTGQRDVARQGAAAWQESAEKNRAALEDMTATHAKLQTTLEQDRERQRVKLQEAMRNDSKTRDWGGVVLPSFVDGMLR